MSESAVAEPPVESQAEPIEAEATDSRPETTAESLPRKVELKARYLPIVVHANTQAIRHNAEIGREHFPTCVVVDSDSKRHEFHEVRIKGEVVMSYEPNARHGCAGPKLEGSTHLWVYEGGEVTGHRYPGLPYKFDPAAAKDAAPPEQRRC